LSDNFAEEHMTLQEARQSILIDQYDVWECTKDPHNFNPPFNWAIENEVIIDWKAPQRGGKFITPTPHIGKIC
jgi:hypothetical protein